MNIFEWLLQQHFHRIDERLEGLETKMAATQTDIDAITAKLVADETLLATVVQNEVDHDANLQAQIDALQAQINAGGTVDLTALQAEADKFSGQLQALIPTPPTAP